VDSPSRRCGKFYLNSGSVSPYLHNEAPWSLGEIELSPRDPNGKEKTAADMLVRAITVLMAFCLSLDVPIIMGIISETVLDDLECHGR
jgi:hypothetical protein